MAPITELGVRFMFARAQIAPKPNYVNSAAVATSLRAPQLTGVSGSAHATIVMAICGWRVGACIQLYLARSTAAAAYAPARTHILQVAAAAERDTPGVRVPTDRDVCCDTATQRPARAPARTPAVNPNNKRTRPPRRGDVVVVVVVGGAVAVRAPGVRMTSTIIALRMQPYALTAARECSPVCVRVCSWDGEYVSCWSGVHFWRLQDLHADNKSI